jgi:type II secretory pathway pseudopilin PulG
MKIDFKSKKRGRLGQVAYTLVEMAVGTALLGIAFVSLYGGMSSGFAVTQVSRENLRATQILLERMEGIRLYNWNQLVYSNWIPSTFTNWYYPLTNPGESQGIMYTGEMTITRNPTLNPAATGYSDSLCAVTTTVNWTSANVPRSRSLTTYVARNGIQNYVFNNTNYITVSE